MTNRFRTKVPPYDWATIVLIVVDDLKKCNAARGEKYEREKGWYIRKGDIFAIAMDRKYICPNYITHESVHAAWEILKESGVLLRRDNDEALTYLAGWISGWMHKKLYGAGVTIKLVADIRDSRKVQHARRK